MGRTMSAGVMAASSRASTARRALRTRASMASRGECTKPRTGPAASTAATSADTLSRFVSERRALAPCGAVGHLPRPELLADELRG